MEDFGSKYDGPFDISFKYARARIYSAPNPVFADGLLREMEPYNVKSWWNLRNDDLFCLRWGDPDYVRAFIKNMPLERTAGFHMGSDGYVWARNFALKDPQQRGQLEIDRHWYNFMLWGRLGYDPSLDRNHFENMLLRRYPEVDPATLYDAWAASSRIMPQVNRFFFAAADFQFSPEGCQGLREGFLTVDHFIKGIAMQGMREISIQDFLALKDPPDPSKVTTPFIVAQNLDLFAADSLRGCRHLRENTLDLSAELESVLTDIEAMAELGQYYADKIRGATRLAQFRKSGEAAHKLEAVTALENALEHWQTYARLMSSQFRPQVLARGQDLDWLALTKDVENEIAFVRDAKADL
jgi:hypothetical protein